MKVEQPPHSSEHLSLHSASKKHADSTYEKRQKQRQQKYNKIHSPLTPSKRRSATPHNQQAAFARIRSTLTGLTLAASGAGPMTAALQSVADGLETGRTPEAWQQVTWRCAALAPWWDAALRRHAQLDEWLTHGRPACFWIGGFYNPRGLLAAVCQEVTRARQGQGQAAAGAAAATTTAASCPLEETFTTAVVTAHGAPTCAPPPEGVYVHGIVLSGARYDAGKRVAGDPVLRAEDVPLPLVHVSAARRSQEGSVAASSASTPVYSCPVYRYPSRGVNNWVFDCDLNIPPGQASERWVLMGVCMLLQAWR